MDYRDAVLYISLLTALIFIVIASMPYPEPPYRTRWFTYVEVKRICVVPMDGKLNVTLWLRPVSREKTVYVEITVGEHDENVTGGSYPANQTTVVSIIVDRNAAVNNTVTIRIDYSTSIKHFVLEKKVAVGTCV